jgi:hypothetical protein
MKETNWWKPEKYSVNHDSPNNTMIVTSGNFYSLNTLERMTHNIPFGIPEFRRILNPFGANTKLSTVISFVVCRCR